MQENIMAIMNAFANVKVRKLWYVYLFGKKLHIQLLKIF